MVFCTGLGLYRKAGGGQLGLFLPGSHDCTGRRFLNPEYSYPSVIVQGTDHDT